MNICYDKHINSAQQMALFNDSKWLMSLDSLKRTSKLEDIIVSVQVGSIGTLPCTTEDHSYGIVTDMFLTV